MGYRVDYNPEMKGRYPAFVKIRKKKTVRPLLLSVFVIVVCYCLYHFELLRYFIPGDAAVTTAAFSGMVDNIGAGGSVRQAFLDFCKEIISNGN